MTRAEKVHDLHTLVEGFGLTMEGKALTWFQTQKMAKFSSFTQLAKEFVREHTKSGLKHDVLSQIHQFKQESNESVRDCASRLRQYLTRCPVMEIPSQERLVSLFLEGLRSQELHSAVYMKHITDLDQCIHEAIEYDDNCAKGASGVVSQTNESKSRSSSQVDEIIQGVTEKMQQMYGPPRVMERRED